MIVVSDTTALTTLLKCGLEWILPRLFEKVFLPREVQRELLAFHEAIPDWCEVVDVEHRGKWEELAAVLDRGEAESILLALALHPDAILLDDRKGRREAEARGIECLALPAVLVAAKREGLIPSVAEAFQLIAERGHFRVGESAAAILLRLAGEA